MRRSAAALAAAILSLAPIAAHADEGGEEGTPTPPTPAEPPPRTDTPAARSTADGPPAGFSFGVQVAGGLGPAITFFGLGAPVTLGVPISFGFAPGFVAGPVHLRLVLAFARSGERSVSDFGGMRVINATWATSFTASPVVEITALTLGALRAFVLAGAQIGILATLSRTDNGMTDTRTKDSLPEYGLLAGFGFRLMLAARVGLGATGGVQWFAMTNSDSAGNSHTTDTTFNAFGTIDLTVFLGMP
jgi:hypothetical protein